MYWGWVSCVGVAASEGSQLLCKDVLLEKGLMVQPPSQALPQDWKALGPRISLFLVMATLDPVLHVGVEEWSQRVLGTGCSAHELVVGNPGAARIDFPLPCVRATSECQFRLLQHFC